MTNKGYQNKLKLRREIHYHENNNEKAGQITLVQHVNIELDLFFFNDNYIELHL